jgi:hypothetical protein
MNSRSTISSRKIQEAVSMTARIENPSSHLLHRQEKKKESSLRKLIGTPANELTYKQNKLSDKASFTYDEFS